MTVTAGERVECQGGVRRQQAITRLWGGAVAQMTVTIGGADGAARGVDTGDGHRRGGLRCQREVFERLDLSADSAFSWQALNA